MEYANEFNEILSALTDNPKLRRRLIELIQNKPILGKSIVEESRVSKFREILVDLVEGNIPSLETSYMKVELALPRNESRYSNNNSVFARGWAERLVRTQLSRFYNQAVLEDLKERGEEECFVPASSSQNLSPRCAVIQNGTYKVNYLLDNLIKNYENGEYDSSLKIPEHPYCSHVVKPKE